MPRSRSLPPAVQATAFLSDEAEGVGISRGRLRGAGVQHPFYGVASVGLDLQSIVDRCRAFEPRMRAGDVFSHLTAAQLWSIPLPTGTAALHVTSFETSTRPRPRGVIGHRVARVIDRRFVLGFAVTSPVDTWCHLAATLSREDLVAVGDAFVTGRRVAGGRLPALCSIAELEVAVARLTGARGRRAMRWAVPRIRSGVDSRPETLLRLLLVSAGYPEPVVGFAIDVGEQFDLHPDLAWPEWRIVFDYEGEEHRLSKRRFRSDIARREAMEAADFRVIRVTSDDLGPDRAAFLARVARVVAKRSAR